MPITVVVMLKSNASASLLGNCNARPKHTHDDDMKCSVGPPWWKKCCLEKM